MTSVGVPGTPISWRGLPLAVRTLLVAVGYALGYVITAKVQPPQFTGSSAFWLANAVVFVMLLWSRPRDWLVYLPAVVVADGLTAHYLWGAAWWDPTTAVAAVSAALNFGESALAAAVLLRLVGVPFMGRTRDVVLFVVVACVLAPAVNTAAAWLNVKITQGVPPDFARTFFIGDMTGMLVLAPALLAWTDVRGRSFRPRRRWVVEAGLLGVVLAGVTVSVFGRRVTSQQLLSPYLLVPVLVWIAVRLGPRAVTAAVLAVATVTTAMTGFDLGPFANRSLTVAERVSSLQLFFVSAVLAALILAAVQATNERQQRELAGAEARFRTGFIVSPIGLAYVDRGGAYRDVNPAFCQLLARPAGELLGMTYRDVTHPEDVDGDNAAIERLAAGEDHTYRAEKRYVRPDGTVVWANMTVAALPDHDGGQPTTFFAQMVDVTARREAEAVLARQATHDPLTGLPNRRLFLELLRAALRRLGRDPGTVAVLFIDVDRFKQVNDLHGHAAGDELLRRIGRIVADAVRPGDVTARHGGDEFTVLLDHLAEDGEAAVIAERILGLLRASTLGPSLEVSIGVATSTDETLAPETLVAHADAAMYRAKSRGGGRWQLFDEVTYATLLQRARTAEELQDALAADQLALFYQPIVRMSDGACVALEALLRWVHPTRGLLEASEFVDVLEHSPALGRISVWVIQRACSDLSGWRRDPDVIAPQHVHVNVVPRQLVTEDLVGLLESAMMTVGLEPGGICVEVTESALADLDQAESVLRRLREAGCMISLDDFGIGHSSLSRLADWPVDQIKVDKSLVQQVTTPRGVALVTAAKRLAETLGCELVAEGVETTDQRDALAALGLDLVQGYLYSGPMPAAAVGCFLRHRAVTR